MKTILIPVDATAAIENAVDFAVAWATRYDYSHIILLKTSYESMFDYISMGATYAMANEENWNRKQEEAQVLLEHLRSRITKKSSSLQVTTETSGLPLLRSTIRLLKNNNSIELIILGSDQKEVANNSFISSNIIGISRASPVKVLIVPDRCTYKPIKHILVPCNISSMDAMKRLERLKTRFERETIQVTLLNVMTSEDAGDDAERKSWERSILPYLAGMQYDVFYAFDHDIIHGILSFTASHDVDIIVALPGKHSFLYYLANKSISEGIYQNIDHAVFILK